MTAMRAQLLALFVARSFQHSDQPIFKLAGGGMSRFYIDCKKTVLTAPGAYLAGRLVYDRVAPLAPGAIGGLTLGADPIAVATSVVSQIEGRPIAAFIVRKEAKGHGTQSWIEGGLARGARVVVLDDVVTTGGSTLKAIEKLRAHGCPIALALALIDRGEGGRAAIEAAGVPFDALFTLDDLRAQAAKA